MQNRRSVFIEHEWTNFHLTKTGQSGMSRNGFIESVVCEYVQTEMGAVETAPAPEGEE
jgi:hypothetical protein